jgi:hypothetical protein
MWMKPLVNVDPDVMFFRSRYNSLKSDEQQLLLDLGAISGFKATSDLPQWMNAREIESLREFLESDIEIQKVNRYQYKVSGRVVDFNPAIPLHTHRNIPVWFAQHAGFLKVARRQILPAILESLKHNHEMKWLLYPLATSLSMFAAFGSHSDAATL